MSPIYRSVDEEVTKAHAQPRADYAQNPGALSRPGSFAHFPGSGPAGKTCWHCAHFTRVEHANGRGGKTVCAEAARLLSKPLRGVNAIAPGTAACRYFKEKPGAD